MPLPDPLTDPVVLAVLTLALAGVLRYQRGLSWTEYRAIHRPKARLFPILDRLKPGGFSSFINNKRYRSDDAEYLRTDPRAVKQVWKTLVRKGGSPHLISSVKERETPAGPQLSAAHVVWTHADTTQTEAYLFPNPDGSTDVYVHHETSVQDPEGHLSDPQTDGDPRGVVTEALLTENDTVDYTEPETGPHF
jgi:hypothetical protein